MKGDTWLLVPHTPQHIGDQVPFCAQEVPQVVGQVRPTRDPPETVSSSRIPRIQNAVDPKNAPVDTEDVPHCPDVYVTGVLGDKRAAPRSRIPRIKNAGDPKNAPVDAEDAPHCPDV